MRKLSAEQLIKKDFIENRSRLLDLAAFFDRVDRFQPENQKVDFRVAALQKALLQLTEGGRGRVNRVQQILSDQSILILDVAEKSQGAFGAPENSCC